MYNELVLSGGGIKGIAMIGALSYLEDVYILKNIKRYVGTSIGGLISFLLIIGYSCSEMKSIILKLNFDDYCDLTLSNLFNNYGFDNFDKIIKIIIAIIKQKGITKDTTFKDLYKKTKKILIITGSNLTKRKIELFSKKHTPNMKILDAIQITMSVPLMFKPVLINNNYYVDGGIYNPYPINYAKKLKTTLGIYLKTTNNNFSNNGIDSLNTYVYRLFSCFYEAFKNKIIEKKKYKKCTMYVDVEHISFAGLGLSEEIKLNTFINGRKTAKKYIETIFNKIRLAYLLKRLYKNYKLRQYIIDTNVYCKSKCLET